MEIAALKLADDYDALKSDLARVTAEREECRAFWTAEADKAATRTTELVRNSAYWEAEATALRAHAAELVAALREIVEWVDEDGADEKYDREIQRICAIALARAETATPAKQEDAR